MERNVRKFVNQCGEYIAEAETEHIIRDFDTYRVESPIEQILYCALNTFCILHKISTHCQSDTFIVIFPQYKIGNYRIDLYASYIQRIGDKYNTIKSMFIECDSQQFHERTEEERRYEKKRDRYLSSKGYTTMHFTGKEIISDPFEVAREIITFIYSEVR